MSIIQVNEIRKVIDDLKKIRLSSYPREEILSLFSQINEKIPIVVATAHPGRIIVRGQLYEPNVDYTLQSRHSYKPAELNTKYQRASIPSHTTFYGSVTSLDDKKDEPLARVTIMSEIGKIIKDKTITEEEYVFSSWEVIDDLNLVAVIQSEEYSEPCNLVRKLQKDYEAKFQNIFGREFMNYIASEFAKDDTREDYNYMISAWYSQIVYDSCYDGVTYPSVRVGGAGMNLAIRPESVNKKLKLIGAAKCKFIKEGEKVTQDKNAEIIIKPAE